MAHRTRVRFRGGAGGGVDADVAAWLAAVASNSGTVSSGTRAAVAAFVASAKASGYWSKLLRINLFCGDQLAAALVPLKVGGGNATDTNVNFVSGDYSEATGLTGNGSSKYLRTGFIPSAQLVANSTAVGLYNRSGGTSGAVLQAQNSTSQQLGLYAPFQAASIAYSQHYNNGGGTVFAAITASFGFVIGSRTAAAVHVLYQNGSAVTNNATSGGSLPTVEMYAFATNNNGTAADYAAGACAGYFVGSGLSAGEVSAITTHMETFQDALGRGVA